MTLLKALQNKITCTTLPWQPRPHSPLVRLVNDIVLNEESDQIEPGIVTSHFEYYVSAMRQMGANTYAIETFLALLKNGVHLQALLVLPEWQPHVVQFLQTTWSIATCGEAHEIAAAFTFGREELIPNMFTQLVQDLNGTQENQLSSFHRYLQRHIELDGDEHGPMAIVLLESLCGDKENFWEDCYHTAYKSLQARKQLWDGIVENLATCPKENAA